VRVEDADVNRPARFGAWIWRRLAGFIDDALPMPPDERMRRDWSDESSADDSRRRQRRLHLRLFEKRGKGGYR
jgi:hypothetical protein